MLINLSSICAKSQHKLFLKVSASMYVETQMHRRALKQFTKALGEKMPGFVEGKKQTGWGGMEERDFLLLIFCVLSAVHSFF